jgi:ubiquinone biosynthesis protein
LAQEFAQTLRLELDYLTEGRNAERFGENFADDATVHIPRVFWERTSSRVITLERVRGTKISDLTMLEANGIDQRRLAKRGTEVILKMIFEDGFFHADLHPGNFFIEPDGRFGLIDFGMVGVVDERTQDHLMDLIVAITSQNYHRLADALLEMGLTRQRVDREMLRRDLEYLIRPYYGRALGEIELSPLLDKAFIIIRRHQLHLLPNLALLAVYHPPGWERLAGVIFAIGFFIAAALGVYLAWSILGSEFRNKNK